MRLFVGGNPVQVMASGAIDVNYKEEVYDGKVSFAKILAFFSDFLWFLFFSVQFLFLNSEHHPVYVIL
jgi:hypothetical protein